MELEYLDKKLESVLREAWQRVYDLYKEKQISLCLAAQMLAVQRILAAEKLRGRLN